MTANMQRRFEHAVSAAVAAQQIATDQRNKLAEQIKRTLTVRQFGAYLAAQARSAQ